MRPGINVSMHRSCVENERPTQAAGGARKGKRGRATKRSRGAVCRGSAPWRDSHAPTDRPNLPGRGKRRTGGRSNLALPARTVLRVIRALAAVLVRRLKRRSSTLEQSVRRESSRCERRPKGRQRLVVGRCSNFAGGPTDCLSPSVVDGTTVKDFGNDLSCLVPDIGRDRDIGIERGRFLGDPLTLLNSDLPDHPLEGGNGRSGRR